MKYNKTQLNQNTAINFNHSKEITDWAKKYNVSREKFQQLFSEANYSIATLLQSGALKRQ